MNSTNPIINLFQSRKAILTMIITALCFAAFFMGKATWNEISDLLKFVFPGWLLAQGIEDGVKKWGASKQTNVNAPNGVILNTSPISEEMPTPIPTKKNL